MNAKKLGLTVLLLVVISPLVFGYMRVDGIQESSQIDVATPELRSEGSPAIDWTMKELISNGMMTFSSDFAGKVVMYDFMATWCGPCIAAMPTLIEINNHYAGQDFEMISISLDDPAMAESTLETFYSTHSMNWLLFHDKTRVTDAYYNIEFIPTLMIFSKTHYMYYSEVGLSNKDILYDVIDELLAMDDSAAPVINNVYSDKTEVTAANCDLTVTANIAEDYPRHLRYKLTMGEYTETIDFWNPDEGNTSHLFDLDPRIVYNQSSLGYDNITIDVLAEDYAALSATDDIVVDLTHVPDAGDPTVTDIVLSDSETIAGINLEISATIADDIGLASQKIEIWKNAQMLGDDETLDHDTGDTYTTTFYGLNAAVDDEVQIKFIVEDVAGNVAEITHLYTVTGNSGIGLPVVLGCFILGSLIIIPIRRRKQK